MAEFEAAGTAVHVTKTSKEEKKQYPWFKEEVGEIPELMRKVLEEYSGIPPDKVKSHVQEIVSISTWIYITIPLNELLPDSIFFSNNDGAKKMHAANSEIGLLTL